MKNFILYRELIKTKEKEGRKYLVYEVLTSSLSLLPLNPKTSLGHKHHENPFFLIKFESQYFAKCSIEKSWLKSILLIFFFSCSYILKAQDPQYSQYYANALYLSPAFAGADENTRAITAARYQWPGLNSSFVSQSASVDHYISKYKSGIGVLINSDVSTAAKLKSVEAGFIYAFQADLSKKIAFRPALQLSFVNRTIDFSKLTFGSQYDNEGFHGGTTNEASNTNMISYTDVATGGVLYSEKYWIGVSAHHLNRPDQSFIRGESRLPVKTALFGGYKFSFTPEWRKKHVNPDEEKSITPTLLYKMQGKMDQLDVGIYGRYNTLIVGAWYRGIPVKVYKNERSNNDALVFLAGFIYNRLSMSYSYDFTISALTFRSGGSHEVALSYAFKKKKSKKIQKRLPCPKF